MLRHLLLFLLTNTPTANSAANRRWTAVVAPPQITQTQGILAFKLSPRTDSGRPLKNWPPSMKVKKMENFWNKRGLKGCRWSSLNAPGTEHPLSHPLLGLEEFPFPHYWPSGVIRIGLPVWRWKSWKFVRTKWVERDANGPVWMSQALKTLCLIHFWSWVISLFW